MWDFACRVLPRVYTLVNTIFVFMKIRQLRKLLGMGGMTDRFSVKTTKAQKDDLREALKAHPKAKGSLSVFITDAVDAFILQTRQGRVPAWPLEFVVDESLKIEHLPSKQPKKPKN
jgi:hypothetical protein